MSYVSSFGDVSRKDDVVLNAVEILTARETMIFNMLGKTEAIDTVHMFLVDTLRTAAANAQTEVGSYTYLDRTTPTRLSNIVQNIAIPFRVSRTQQKIQHYHGEDELARQTTKALMEFANDAEFNLLRSTGTSGASGTAPTMNGIIAAISKSTNVTAHTSGTALVASIIDGLASANWTNSNGDVATDLFMGSFLRTTFDGFTQKTNTVVNSASVTAIIRTVQTYETAFGTLVVHKHRYIQAAADATARMLCIRPDKLKVAFLEKPYIDDGLSRDGDFTPRAVVGKMTLEVRNQDSNWFTSGFLKA